MAELLSPADLPRRFEYPAEFLRVVELGLTNLEPWWILQGEELRRRHLGIRKRYGRRGWVLFAARQDNDDTACFNLRGHNVVIVHDYTTPGWAQRGSFDSFYDWLGQAVEDLIEFDNFPPFESRGWPL